MFCSRNMSCQLLSFYSLCSLSIQFDSGVVIVFVIGFESMNIVSIWVWYCCGNQSVRQSSILGKNLVFVMLRMKWVMVNCVVFCMNVVRVVMIFQEIMIWVIYLWVLNFFSSRLFGILNSRYLMKKMLVVKLNVVFVICRVVVIFSFVKLVLFWLMQVMRQSRLRKGLSCQIVFFMVDVLIWFVVWVLGVVLVLDMKIFLLLFEGIVLLQYLVNVLWCLVFVKMLQY